MQRCESNFAVWLPNHRRLRKRRGDLCPVHRQDRKMLPKVIGSVQPEKGIIKVAVTMARDVATRVVRMMGYHAKFVVVSLLMVSHIELRCRAVSHCDVEP